jgi:hypothetical protein
MSESKTFTFGGRKPRTDGNGWLSVSEPLDATTAASEEAARHYSSILSTKMAKLRKSGIKLRRR